MGRQLRPIDEPLPSRLEGHDLSVQVGSGNSVIETGGPHPSSTPASFTWTATAQRLPALTHDPVPHDYAQENWQRAMEARREKAKAAKQARKRQAKLRRQRR